MSAWLHLGCMECREDIPVGKTHWETVVENYATDVQRFLLRHRGHHLVAVDDSSDLLLGFVGGDRIPWNLPPPVAVRLRPESSDQPTGDEWTNQAI